jgi:hypothetical protein
VGYFGDRAKIALAVAELLPQQFDNGHNRTMGRELCSPHRCGEVLLYLGFLGLATATPCTKTPQQGTLSYKVHLLRSKSGCLGTDKGRLKYQIAGCKSFRCGSLVVREQ